MDILEQLGVALGLATLAGVNLYLTVLITGLAIRFDFLNLAAQYHQLEVLGDPIVLIVAGVLFCIEFFADKIPWVDSLWDSFHTVIRPVGGVLLGLTALGEMPVHIQVVAALFAGGAALTTHGAKASTRLLINHSPEPVSNTALSVTEDVAVVGGTALTLLNPVVAFFVFFCMLVAIWLVFPRIWRSMRAVTWLAWHKLKGPGVAPLLPLKSTVDENMRNLLKSKVGVAENDIVAIAPCLSGKARGVRGLCQNLKGTIILTGRDDTAYFVASKGLSDRVFALPLVGARVFAETRFLSENLLLETPAGRLMFRFPRGQGAIVGDLLVRVTHMLERNRLSAPTPVPVREPVAPPAVPAKPQILPVPAVG